MTTRRTVALGATMTLLAVGLALPASAATPTPTPTPTPTLSRITGVRLPGYDFAVGVGSGVLFVGKQTADGSTELWRVPLSGQYSATKTVTARPGTKIAVFTDGRMLQTDTGGNAVYRSPQDSDTVLTYRDAAGGTKQLTTGKIFRATSLYGEWLGVVADLGDGKNEARIVNVRSGLSWKLPDPARPTGMKNITKQTVTGGGPIIHGNEVAWSSTVTGSVNGKSTTVTSLYVGRTNQKYGVTNTLIGASSNAAAKPQVTADAPVLYELNGANVVWSRTGPVRSQGNIDYWTGAQSPSNDLTKNVRTLSGDYSDFNAQLYGSTLVVGGDVGRHYDCLVYDRDAAGKDTVAVLDGDAGIAFGQTDPYQGVMAYSDASGVRVVGVAGWTVK